MFVLKNRLNKMQQSLADICITELCTCSSLHICICRGSRAHIHTSGQNRGMNTHAHTNSTEDHYLWVTDSPYARNNFTLSHIQTHAHKHKPSNPEPRHPVTFLRHPQTNTARPNHTRALELHKIQISAFSLSATDDAPHFCCKPALSCVHFLHRHWAPLIFILAM